VNTNPSPDTVSEAVELLRALGFDEEVEIDGKLLRCAAGAAEADGAHVLHQFRFEGPSDPADEAIVLGIEIPALGVRGIVVSGYGASVEPGSAEVLRALAAR